LTAASTTTIPATTTTPPTPSYTVFVPKIEENDLVTYNFTIWDNLNRAIISTDQQIYSNSVRNGNIVFFTQPMTIPVNVMINDTFVGVKAYNPASGSWVNFGMLGQEIQLISQELNGMSVGETKTIDLTSLYSSNTVLSKEEFEQLGGNYNEAFVGQMYPWEFSDAPGSAPSENYYRIVEILDKPQDGITLSYLYSKVEITVVTFV
jgi:hypothetical protein